MPGTLIIKGTKFALNVNLLDANLLIRYCVHHQLSRKKYQQITISHRSTLEGSPEHNFQRHRIAIILEQNYKLRIFIIYQLYHSKHIIPRQLIV